ncbi:hypothetical protein CLF_106552 [Clonorchis sinensis]|uniref:Uncharacterized protein n=1 Tax=Clonorchis sinensis TaxID=79923 RepID=G7YFC0_CLOSI|nr:hypothetical protein CLF_106552 [Clonorchis sinensis]
MNARDPHKKARAPGTPTNRVWPYDATISEKENHLADWQSRKDAGDEDPKSMIDAKRFVVKLETRRYTGRVTTGAGQGGVACWYTPLGDLDLFFCTSRDLYPLFRFRFRCRIHVCLQRGRSAFLSVRRACCASTCCCV